MVLALVGLNWLLILGVHVNRGHVLVRGSGETRCASRRERTAENLERGRLMTAQTDYS